jgi:hypothetical protein
MALSSVLVALAVVSCATAGADMISALAAIANTDEQ